VLLIIARNEQRFNEASVLYHRIVLARDNETIFNVAGMISPPYKIKRLWPHCEENMHGAPSVGCCWSGRRQSARNSSRLSRDRGHIVWFSNSSRYFLCLLFIIVNWYIVRRSSPCYGKTYGRGKRGVICCGYERRRGRNVTRTNSAKFPLYEVMETRLLDNNEELCFLYFYRHNAFDIASPRWTYVDNANVRKWIW